MYSIGAVVILCFVVLILAVIVLLMFDSKSGKVRLGFMRSCCFGKHQSNGENHSVINIQANRRKTIAKFGSIIILSSRQFNPLVLNGLCCLRIFFLSQHQNRSKSDQKSFLSFPSINPSDTSSSVASVEIDDALHGKKMPVLVSTDLPVVASFIPNDFDYEIDVCHKEGNVLKRSPYFGYLIAIRIVY